MIWQKVATVYEETAACFFKGAADGDIVYNSSLLCVSDRKLHLARQYLISSTYSFRKDREQVSNLRRFTITGKCFFFKFPTCLWYIFPGLQSRRNGFFGPSVVTLPTTSQGCGQISTDNHSWGQCARWVQAWVWHRRLTDITFVRTHDIHYNSYRLYAPYRNLLFTICHTIICLYKLY